MLTTREVIAAKIESTYNVDAAPGVTDAILVENPGWANEGLRMTERNPVKPTFGRKQSVYGGHLRTITFDAELKGSGTAGTAPEIGVLLRACAFDETVVASTSVTYAPVSTGIESLTIYYYEDGLLRKLTGARGAVNFNLEAGAVGKASFTFTGHDAGTTDTALITPTYDSTAPAELVSVPFDFGGYSAVISKLAIDTGNAISMPPSIAASDGFGEIIITGRDVSGSFDPEAVLKATKDWEAMLSGGTSAALDTGTIGSAGNQYRIQMPVCYLTDISPGDLEGKRIYETPFQAVESSGDDQISIAFT